MKTRMDGATRSYLREFGAAMIAYVVVLFLSIWAITTHLRSSWRYPVALLPMIPAGFALVAVVRHLGRLDELQRRIQFEALAFAFGGTALVTFGYGFVENVGFPHLSWFWVWPLMALLWALGLVLANRRYRA